MNVLLIEDDDEKLNHITEFLKLTYPECVISIARSFDSGLRLLNKHKNDASVALIDMSMPSYDVSENEPSGGPPEGFAGRELLAQMKLRRLKIPVVIVTMFDSFSEKNTKTSLEQLAQEMRDGYSPPFSGLVYYDSRQEGWRTALRDSITAALKDRIN